MVTKQLSGTRLLLLVELTYYFSILFVLYWDSLDLCCDIIDFWFFRSLECVASLFNENGKNGTHKCISSHTGWFHCWPIVGQRFGIQKWKLLFIYMIVMCVLMQSFCLPASPNSLPESVICPHKVRSLWVMLRFIKLLLLREPNNEPSVNMKKWHLN